jgi:hypothetical protein
LIIDKALLTTLNRVELVSKDDWSLIWTCVSPFIFRMRGKRDLMKMDVYKELSDHQRRLFIFTVYYNHARQSVDDFIYYSKLLLENNYWRDLKAAMHFFNDQGMIALLDQIEMEMTKSINAAATELPTNDSWGTSVNALFKIFLPVSDKTLKLIGDDIRSNPIEYFNLKN